MQDRMSPVVFDKDVHTVDRTASVRAVVAVMVAKQISSVLVVEERRPVGIFTERDAVRRVLHQGLDPETTRVEQVMTSDVQTIGPETRIQEALAIMSQGSFRHLPVMHEGKLAGMVSVGDLTHDLNQHNDYLISYITRG